MSRRLIDDCFVHDKDRLRHHDALEILRTRLSPVVGEERVDLPNAAGRIIAETITATAPVPGTDNAAVDGYAFAHGDFAGVDGTFPLSGRVAAGDLDPPPLKPGTAVRIFTGAVMPDGADTVAMQEDCDTDGQTSVTIPPGLKAGANRRRAGEDVSSGSIIVEPGIRLRPQEIAAIATTGAAQIMAFAPVRVAIMSTGNEIVELGRERAAGQVHDSNKPMLRALLAGLPTQVTDLGVLADDETTVRQRLAEAAARFDLVITTGGASRGEEDHLIEAVEALGTRHLWQLAIKPGRPMSFGQIGNCVVLTLPGNPVAVFVCFLLYARQTLLALGGADWKEPTGFWLPAGFEMPRKKPDRR
ncbi:MAG: molybdopterin molybdotransferase MoeA, partial [Pseudomonadota bacterium]